MAKEIKNTRHSSPTPFKMLSHKGIWGDEWVMSCQALIISIIK